jgi:hypothetical protein
MENSYARQTEIQTSNFDNMVHQTYNFYTPGTSLYTMFRQSQGSTGGGRTSLECSKDEWYS